MINFVPGQAAENAGFQAQFIEQLGGKMSEQDKRIHDRLLEDPAYRSEYLAGRLNAQFGRALTEASPEQREVTMRYVDMAVAVRRKMNENLNRNNDRFDPSPKRDAPREPPLPQKESAPTRSRKSLSDMLGDTERDAFINTLRNPDTKMWINRPGPNGTRVRVQLRLKVPAEASPTQIQDALNRIDSDGLEARDDGGLWKPIGEIPALKGWKPSAKTGIVVR